MNTLQWHSPYSSRRSPVMARNVVASSQPLASQAGLRALAAGGNAVDAALATAITLTVVEPCSNGIGSDAFAIVYDGQRLHGLNASGRAPLGFEPARFAHLGAVPERGWDSVTVPGCVSAWVMLSERFGRLPFAQLFDAAIDYAENGWMVTPVIATQWRNAVVALATQPDFQRYFLVDGEVPACGSLFRFPDQAASLRLIAATRGEAFYRGELAHKIAAHSDHRGGCLGFEDLADHQSDWVDTIHIDYRGYQLHEIPPNGQGLASLVALGILRHFDLDKLAVDGADSVHLQIEAMKFGIADAFNHVADSEAMQVNVNELLAPSRLAALAEQIDHAHARTLPPVAADHGGTVYLTSADASGMMVSLIQSNYMGFGSGIVVPDTGISLQNRGAGFVMTDGHPNRVGPRKRPFHTIIPGFLMRGDQPVMSFGVMGGHMQAQGHVQMTVRYVDHGQNPQIAADAPRWHVTEDFDVVLEDGFDDATGKALADRGHNLVWPAKAETFGGLFGGAQLIVNAGHGYIAGSEPRKDGQAVGY